MCASYEAHVYDPVDNVNAAWRYIQDQAKAGLAPLLSFAEGGVLTGRHDTYSRGADLAAHEGQQ